MPPSARGFAITMCACAALISTSTFSSVACADDADDAFATAEAADKSLDFATALRAYRRALAQKPSAPYAIRARVRAEDLASHSEGDFAPLARLEAVRRDPHLANDAEALSALEQDARAFPKGRVKGESLLLVAEGFGRRLKLPARSVGAAEAVARDPSVDRVLRSEALSIACEDLVAMNQPSRAFRLARDLRAISPTLFLKFEREGRRDSLRTVALVGALLVALAGIVSGVLVARRKGVAALVRVFRAPLPYLAALILAAGGAFLAHLFDESVTLRPFYFLGVGVLVVDRSIAMLARALGGKVGRAVAFGTGVVGIVSVALLALIFSDPTFIESFGL